jgi:hypothetical protein
VAKDEAELSGEALVKETCRRIRLARSYWDAHNNAACRGEREKALELYGKLDKAQKEGVPQVLRVWLRYRSEKYFGEDRTPPGSGGQKRKANVENGKKKANAEDAKPGRKGRRGND